MPEPINPPADGCGCQYDAAGRRFRTRCICPPPTTPEQTLRGVAGLGGEIGDAVRDLLAERDALSLMLRGMARRLHYARRARRTAQGFQFQAQCRSDALLKRVGSAVGVRRAGYGGRGEANNDVENILAASLRQRADLIELRAQRATALALHAEVRVDSEGYRGCVHCGGDWPCDTRRALGATDVD